MQTVVITGGSARIGRAVAEMYVGRGNRVGLIARSQERRHDAAEDARIWGQTAESAALRTEKIGHEGGCRL
jgi:NAD(P)-dependent dehydrogenase (short-subunit alcohol dehydrogenase family)